MSALVRRSCLILWMSCAVLLATGARAQPAVAQKHLAEGERAGREGRWEHALAEFRKADEAQPSAAAALRIANALYQLGRVIEAHDAYAALLEKHQGSIFAVDRQTAEQRREELAGKIGSVTIRVSEKDATVSIDGKPVGTSPLAEPVRVVAGEHLVAVQKAAFSPHEEKVQVAGKGAVEVAVRLEPVAASEQPAPAAEPPPAAPTGSLEVRIDDEQGAIFVDGERVGEGSYQGRLPAGEHRVRVTRSGYEPFDKTVTIRADDVHVETVVLKKSAAGDVAPSLDEGDWTFDGLYGGLALAGLFQPLGSGHTLEDACDASGATSCDGGTVTGGGLAGYIGYAFAPVGLELFLLAAGDVVQPSATFDGRSGSHINPLVAEPARDERFTIGRFGGGGAIRARLLFPISRFRITAAAGVGLAYKYLLLKRETTAEGGFAGEISDDGKGYLTPVLSFEAAGQVRLAGNTALALGLGLWLEHAGNNVQTEPRGDVFLRGPGGEVLPHATPAYDMASGTQLYIGPFVGLQFGP